jgi:transposase
MKKAYSEDLRKCVINCYEAGFPKTLIIQIFAIGKDTLNRWIRQYKETGSLAPKVRTEYKRKFSDEDLLSYIKQHPSATLEEIATHLSVKIPSVHARLEQCGVTRKKKRFFMKKEMNKHALNLSNNSK